MRVLGEDFGGFSTTDSSDTVVRYYGERLSEQGWRDGWYQNMFGYCYTLLIIPSIPTASAAPADSIQIGLKLRQAFSLRAGHIGPARVQVNAPSPEAHGPFRRDVLHLPEDSAPIR